MSGAIASDHCYVCGCVVSGNEMERDHFPIPESMGGSVTLPTCRGCHTTKDRAVLASWDPALTFSALHGVWLKASREERLVLAKMFHILSMALNVEEGRVGRTNHKSKRAMRKHGLRGGAGDA